jgi:hypothetical protein
MLLTTRHDEGSLWVTAGLRAGRPGVRFTSEARQELVSWLMAIRGYFPRGKAVTSNSNEVINAWSYTSTVLHVKVYCLIKLANDCTFFTP